MDLGLSNKIAMVAAASKGIGLATAQLLAAEGCMVSICGRHQDSLDSAAATFKTPPLTCIADVSKPDDLARWLTETQAKLGNPSILVTNTGGPPAGRVQDMTTAQWQSGFESTLLNVVLGVNAVAPLMTEAGWGRIVHITSLVARAPSDLLPISSTLRSGLIALTQLQAREYASKGVTVNAVLPGHTHTDRQVHLAEIRSQREGITIGEAMKRQGEAVPIGRLGRPEEIAAAIVFLCGAPASYITGQSLLVDGGLVSGV